MKKKENKFVLLNITNSNILKVSSIEKLKSRIKVMNI